MGGESLLNGSPFIMKKKLAILFLLLSVAVGGAYYVRQQKGYKEGDILFQVSKSGQSPLIQKATGSKWSHCGVVVEKDPFNSTTASGIARN